MNTTMKTINDFSVHSAKGLGAVVGNAVVGDASKRRNQPTVIVGDASKRCNQPTVIVGDASKRRNQPTVIVGDASKRSSTSEAAKPSGNLRNVTLGGVTHYIVTLGGVTHYAAILFMMLLTTATAWAGEVTATYQAKFTYMGGLYNIILQRSGNSSQSATIADKNSVWPKNTGVCVNDEYDVTFKPSQNLSIVVTPNTTTASGFIMSSGTFTASVASGSSYYIKQVRLLDNGVQKATSATAPNSRSATVTASGSIQFNYIEVTLTDDYYGTITPQNGLTVSTAASLTYNNTNYYKAGTTVTVAPTNQYHIVEGTGGTGSASATIANDKRSFSFTMPSQNVSPTATLTEVYKVSPASGITLSPAAYFTYGGNKYYKPNTTITLSSNVPTGQHVIYKAGNNTLGGNTYTVNSTDRDVTITAEYPYNTYTVQFNKNHTDATGSMSSQTFTYGTAQNLKDNAFTRTGYTFAGWNTKADGNGTSYDNGESVSNLTTTNGGTVTLYAQWTPITYYVAFNGNGKTSGSMTSQSFTYDVSQNLKANAFTRAFTVTYNYNGATGGNSQASATANATFNGWATSAGGAKVYDDKENVNNLTTTNGATVTLYAKWTDGSVTLPKPAKTGYTFGGWYSDEELKESVGNGGDSYTPTANVTLYAKWDIVTYTITYDLVYGNVAEAKTTYTVEDDDFTLNNPTKDHFTFTGWTGSNGTTPQTAVTITKGSYAEDLHYTANYAVGAHDGTCGADGADVYYAYDSSTNTFEIFGTGDMKDYDRDTDRPWYSYYKDIKTVVIGNGVKSIGSYAFYDCNSLTSITIPASVTSIGDIAFNKCSSLATITIPDGVTNIGNDVFYGCTSLRAAVLDPETPPSLGRYAFNDCPSLNVIGVPAGTAETYKSANGWKAYADKIRPIDSCGNNVHYSYDSATKILSIFGTGAMADYNGTNMPWKDYRSDIENVIIDHGVTSIGNAAFSGCTKMLLVVLNSAEPLSLGANAFDGCTSLNAIGVPSGSVEAYKAAEGWKAYAGKIRAADGSCGADGAGVFYSYDSATKTLSIFGKGAMTDKTTPWATYRADIKTVVIGNGVTSIGHQAFINCSSLTSVTIPDGVTIIDNDVFYGCTSLTGITIPNGVTSIGSAAFRSCHSLASIHIPASVTTIGSYAFWDCSGLNSITVAAGNPTYDSRNGCNALIEKETNRLILGSNNTVIPDNVTTIRFQAFYHCTGLESIEIPASVTSIGGGAFTGCSGLESISVASGNTVYYSEGNCNCIIETASHTLIQGCKNTVIPNSVTTIGEDAFKNCTGLTGITIPASVTSIDGCAFEGCTALTSIEIPASVTSIGGNAFEGCTALASITIPASVTTIGNYAFQNCSGLESFSVAAENTTYDSRNNCNALIKTETNTLIQGFKNTVIPDDVTTIGSQAFYCCTGLTSIEIPASVTVIGGSAFQGCTSLTSVTIYPPSLPVTTVFGDNASDLKIYVFSDCVDTYKGHAPAMGVDKDDILPIAGISLKDNGDNSSLITAADGASLNVTLQGRTLYKDGKWNTLCLPFNVTVGSGQMAGATAMTLNGSESGFNASTGELTLYFDGVGEGNTIAAGTPFIVKWTGSDVTNPVFSGVTVSSTAAATETTGSEWVDFIGTFSPQVIYEDGTEKHNLYLGADNTLYYPTAENFKVNAFRGWFQLKNGLTAGAPSSSGEQQVRAFKLGFGDSSESTGIREIDTDPAPSPSPTGVGRAAAWYSLDGRKLDGKPTARGIYVHGGRKVAIK